MTEIVLFYEDAGTHAGTDTVFGITVIVVVVHVEVLRNTYAGMTGVTVVKPVMMIGDIVHLILVGVQVTLARVPVVVVRDSGKERTLHIEAAIALGLVTAFVLTIEDIKVVPPDMLVVGIKADTVLGMHHDTQVPQLHITAVATEHTEAVEGGIIAHALDGEVHVLALAFHLQTDG